MSDSESPTRDETPAKAPEADAAQERFTALVTQANEIGPQDDSYVTPAYVKRLAAVYNISVPASLSVLPGKDGKGFRFTRYLTPEQEEAWLAEVGKSTRIEVARAAIAKVLGFTPQDVDDVAFLAGTKAPSKAKEALLAWVREYEKRYVDEPAAVA